MMSKNRSPEYLSMNQVVTSEPEATSDTQSVVVQDGVRVRGEVMSELPQDLYIPPDALQVFLETFQGPLDLLLYLIRKQNIDILDIPIKSVTEQYMKYVEMMQHLKLELAAEYLLMAAMLAEIKSRLLLPKPKLDEEQEGDDPRAELVKRLQQYERYKKAAEDLSALPQVDRDIFVASAQTPIMDLSVAQPDVKMQDLLDAFVSVMTRAKLFADHKVERENLSIRERMLNVLARVKENKEFIPFVELFTVEEGKMGVVVTLIAILELIRQSTLELVQSQPYAPIYIKAKG